jgi:hypothetical protein
MTEASGRVGCWMSGGHWTNLSLERHARNPQLEVALGQTGHTFLRVIRWQRIITMQTVTKKLIVESPPLNPVTGKAPEIASASVPDTLAALHVNPETALMHTEVAISTPIAAPGCRPASSRPSATISEPTPTSALMPRARFTRNGRRNEHETH